jgi:hypothetical protein
MHQEALASGAAVTGGIGGTVTLVIVVLGYVARMAFWMPRRRRRYTSTSWPNEVPGGGFKPREADAPPAELSAEEQRRRERTQAYWAAEQPPEDTMPAEGFIIGEDIAAPVDAARDPNPTGR